MDLLFLANARGTKPIVELETPEEQLQVFAGLPESVQERMLRDHLLHLQVVWLSDWFVHSSGHAGGSLRLLGRGRAGPDARWLITRTLPLVLPFPAWWFDVGQQYPASSVDDHLSAAAAGGTLLPRN